MDKKIEYLDVNFAELDKLRIEHEDKIIKIIGDFEPLAGEDGTLFGRSHSWNRFIDIKLSEDGLVLINTGIDPDLAEIYEVITIIPIEPR